MHAGLHADAFQAGLHAGGLGREAGTASGAQLVALLAIPCMDMTPPMHAHAG